MYAIVATGGKQYRVKPGDTVAVELLAGEPGETLDLEQVLLVGGDGTNAARVGSPAVAGAVVRAEVVEHIRGEKLIIFRYKSKVRYRRKTGHRQSLTRLRITDIVLDGASSVAVVDEQRVSAAPIEPGLSPEGMDVADVVETTPVALAPAVEPSEAQTVAADAVESEDAPEPGRGTAGAN
jgi:large subunit ribosomal protein L21